MLTLPASSNSNTTHNQPKPNHSKWEITIRWSAILVCALSCTAADTWCEAKMEQNGTNAFMFAFNSNSTQNAGAASSNRENALAAKCKQNFKLERKRLYYLVLCASNFQAVFGRQSFCLLPNEKPFFNWTQFALACYGFEMRRNRRCRRRRRRERRRERSNRVKYLKWNDQEGLWTLNQMNSACAFRATTKLTAMKKKFFFLGGTHA